MFTHYVHEHFVYAFVYYVHKCAHTPLPAHSALNHYQQRIGWGNTTFLKTKSLLVNVFHYTCLCLKLVSQFKIPDKNFFKT